MKRWFIVLSVFVLVAAPLVTGIWLLIQPQYQACAEIRVRQIVPRLVFDTDHNGQIPFYESFVRTQASILKSPAVMQRVLDQPKVQQTQWYADRGGRLVNLWREKPVPPLERLKVSLSAEARPATEILDVSFVGPDAADAKLILDTVLKQYLVYQGEAGDVEEEQLYRQLANECKSLEIEVQGREEVCARLRKTLRTADPETLLSQRSLHWDQAKADLADVRDRITLLEFQISHTPTGTDDETPASTAGPAQKQPEYHEDAEWRQWDIAARTARHEIEVGNLQPNAPGAVRAQKELEFAQSLVELRERQLDEQWRDGIARRPVPPETIPESEAETEAVLLSRELAWARQEEHLLGDRVRQEELEYLKLYETAQLYDGEHRTLGRRRELYDAARTRLDQMAIERNANVPGAVSVLSAAYVPSEPYKDRRLVFTGGALALGLLAAVVAGVLTRKTKGARAV